MDNTCLELNWIHREQKFTTLLLHETCGSLTNLYRMATALGNPNEIDLCMELKIENRRQN